MQSNVIYRLYYLLRKLPLFLNILKLPPGMPAVQETSKSPFDHPPFNPGIIPTGEYHCGLCYPTMALTTSTLMVFRCRVSFTDININCLKLN